MKCQSSALNTTLINFLNNVYEVEFGLKTLGARTSWDAQYAM